MITVSVPGKINLMGDHAVVHGKPTLLSSVNLRMRVSIKKGKKKGITIVSSEPPEYALYAVNKVCEHFQIEDIPPLLLTIDSDIPAGYHLGSSAATAVGVVAATTYFLKKIWNPNLINTIAYEVEKKKHGNPSGGDNTAVTFGGLLWFRKELEFLKSLWQFPFSIPKNLHHFYLLDTGRPAETTGEMVSFVKEAKTHKEEIYEKAFALNELQTKRIASVLKEGNEKELIEAMKAGEQTLETMGVVSKKVLPAIRAIERQGGACKILGGGGRKSGVGFLLCYYTDPERIKKIGKQYGHPVQSIVLGGYGVRLERKE